MASDIAVFISPADRDALDAVGAIETIGDPTSEWTKIETPALARFSDKVEAPIFDREKLIGVSKRYGSSFLIVAFESTQDLFFFELIERGTTLRRLCYGFEGGPAWTQAEGDSEDWEEEAFFDDEEGEIQIGTDSPRVLAKVAVEALAEYYRLPGKTGTYFDIERY
jgi:hypothetical protein